MGNTVLGIAAGRFGVGTVLVNDDRAFRRIIHLKIEDWAKFRLSTHSRIFRGATSSFKITVADARRAGST